MAGFETVVRPVVFPAIRPQPARQLPLAEDPEKGFAVIHGNGGKAVEFTNSFSVNASTSKRMEKKRRVDRARVHQKKDDGSINRNNYVDIDVANKIWMEGRSQPPREEGDPILTEKMLLRKGERALNETWVEYYQRIEKEDNIEIKKKNIMKFPQRPAQP